MAVTNRGRVADLKHRRSELDRKRNEGLMSEAEHRLECLSLDAEFHGEHWDQDRWHRHIEATESAMADVQAESLALARELVAGCFDRLWEAELTLQ